MFKSIFGKKTKVSEVNFDDLTNKLMETNIKLAEQLKLSTTK